MQKVKAFFYVSLGILALAAAFQLGAQSAQGQAMGAIAAVGGNIQNYDAGGMAYNGWVVMQNGDVYGWRTFTVGVPPQYLGNLFSGAPVQTQGTTWGRIKAERR